MYSNVMHTYPTLYSLLTNNSCWCVFPFSSISISTEGSYSFCCSSLKFIEKIQNVSITDYFQLSSVKSIVCEMLSGIKGTTYKTCCNKCYSWELKGIASKRIKTNNQILYKLQNGIDIIYYQKLEKLLSKMIQGYYPELSERIFSLLDFKLFGNLCNLKCVMCNPTSSSSIALDEKRKNNWNKPTHFRPYAEFSVQQKKIFFDEMDIILPNTQTINFTGGEPLLNTDMIEYIQYVVDKKYSENLNIFITTNGMYTSSKFIDLFQFFKNTAIHVSIDGYGIINELQRINSNFETIDNTLSFYKKYSFLSLHIGTTITPINIAKLDDLFDYSINKINKKPFINLCLIPTEYSIRCLPKELRKFYFSKLSKSKYNSSFSIILDSLNCDDVTSEIYFETYIKNMIQFYGSSTILKHFPEYFKYVV